VSGRPASFIVTAASEKVKLDNSGAARAPFTVTNRSAQGLRGHLLTRPREPAKPEWVSVVGDPVRDFAANAAEQVVVQLDVPRGSPPGSYSFRLDAVSEDDPDEDFTEGPSVAFEVTPPPQPKKPFPWWILIAVGAVVLLAIIGVVVWLLVRDEGPKPVAVPAVLGMSARAAESTLTNAGFTVSTRSVPVSDPTQNGVVQSQDPAAGTVQPPGTVVTLTVGHMSLVPSVKGLAESKAKTTLADADLKVAVRNVAVQDAAQNGIVLDQDPAAGTLQPPGTLVTITVGHSSRVPSVKGLAESTARTALADADLNVAVRNVGVQDPAQNGIVQDQDPAAGTLQPPGTVVTITVGRNVAVPDVRGRDQADAVAALNDAGLRASVTRVPAVDPGTVLSQNPAPGTRVPLGSVVQIRVGACPGGICP
jgi:beta-lactam-binding protein with PASTA domain